MMRNIRRMGFLAYLLGAAAVAQAGSLIPEGADFNRTCLEIYSATLVQNMEFGYDDGGVVRGGYSKLGYLSNSLVFFQGGLLMSWNFDRNAFGLVPTFKMGLAPLFVGLSRTMFDRQNAGLLNYEFGLTAYMIEAKVSLADFRRAAFFVSFNVPLSAIDSPNTFREFKP